MTRKEENIIIFCFIAVGSAIGSLIGTSRVDKHDNVCRKSTYKTVYVDDNEEEERD